MKQLVFIVLLTLAAPALAADLTDAEFDRLVDAAIKGVSQGSKADDCKTWVDCKVKALESQCPSGTTAVIDRWVYGHGARLMGCRPDRAGASE